MMDPYALLVAAFSFASLLIWDRQIYLLYVGLVSFLAILLYIIAQSPATFLGMVPLSLGALKYARVARRRGRRRGIEGAPPARWRRFTIVDVPRDIVDVVPRGSVRRVHKSLIDLLGVVERAEEKGYSVEVPKWLAELKSYMSLVGPYFVATADTVVSPEMVHELG